MDVWVAKGWTVVKATSCSQYPLSFPPTVTDPLIFRASQNKNQIYQHLLCGHQKSSCQRDMSRHDACNFQVISSREGILSSPPPSCWLEQSHRDKLSCNKWTRGKLYKQQDRRILNPQAFVKHSCYASPGFPTSYIFMRAKNKLLSCLSCSYFGSLLYAANSLMLTNVRNMENK